MIWVDSQVSKEQGFAAWLATSAVRLDRNEHGINLCQEFRVVQFQDPPLLCGIVLEEDTKGECLLPVRSAPAPYLKRAGILHVWLLIQVVGVEDERLPLRVKHAPVRLLGR